MEVMIDLETLDTRPSAVILSIGAIRFDIDQPGALAEEFHEHIDIDSSLAQGRTVSGSTILWWLEQSESARDRLLEAQRIPLLAALDRLAAFMRPDDRVWGNGAAFDNAILAHAFDAAGIPAPWRFYNDRCYRTVKAMHAGVPAPAHDGVRHDALDDARRQALHLQAIIATARDRHIGTGCCRDEPAGERDATA